MLKRKLVSILSLAIFSSTALISGFANAATEQNTKSNVTTRQQHKAAREEYIKNHPDLANDLKAFKALPKDQKKAKIQELKKKYPEFFKNFKHRHGGAKGLRKLAKTNPQVANELKAIKSLPKEQRKEKYKELMHKYFPKTNK